MTRLVFFTSIPAASSVIGRRMTEWRTPAVASRGLLSGARRLARDGASQGVQGGTLLHTMFSPTVAE